MKKVLLPICVVAVIGTLISCEEKGPLINTGGGVSEDTTYMATVEAKQNRMSLIEEFTGASCAPCPKGHKLIYGESGIKSQHPNQVAVIAYHIFDFNQAEPVHDKSKYDFRTADASDVGKTIFGGIVQMPIAGVDRTSENNTYLYSTGAWSNKVSTDLTKGTPVNITITSTFNATTREVVAKVKVAYTADVNKKQNLTLAIIENKIIDAQKSLDQQEPILDYEHNSVLRDIITPFYGSPVLDSLATKTAGRVYERTFRFNVKDTWKVENCQLVAFIHNNEGNDKEVIQAAEVHVTE